MYLIWCFEKGDVRYLGFQELLSVFHVPIRVYVQILQCQNLRAYTGNCFTLPNWRLGSYSLYFQYPFGYMSKLYGVRH